MHTRRTQSSPVLPVRFAGIGISLSLEDRVTRILRERRLLDRAPDPDTLVTHFVYAAEHWLRLTEAHFEEAPPYLRYVSSGFEDSPLSHLERHGLIYPLTHPFWTVWYPPNGLHCVCAVMPVSESLLQQRGWTVCEDRPLRFKWPEVGFDFNIGMLLQDRGC
jgi:hypothetical protein